MTLERRIATALMVTLLAALSGCNPEETLLQPTKLDQWTYFNTSSGLPSNHVFSLNEDKTGKMWVGTSGGLSVYNGVTFATYTTVDGLLSNNVYAILDDSGGDLWVGTANGLNIFTEGNWFYFGYFFGAEITSLLELENHDILIGTGGYGVYRYNFSTGALSEYDVSTSCSDCNAILSLFLGSDGAVWIGSNAGAKRIQGTTKKTFNASNGLSGNLVTDFSEDSFGNIWAGSIEGTTVSRIAGNTVEKIAFSNGASQNFTLAIETEKDGTIWVGTVAFGLYQYDGSFMNRIYNGPPGNTTTALLIDTKNNMWVGSTTGGLAKCLIRTK